MKQGAKVNIENMQQKVGAAIGLSQKFQDQAKIHEALSEASEKTLVQKEGKILTEGDIKEFLNELLDDDLILWLTSSQNSKEQRSEKDK